MLVRLLRAAALAALALAAVAQPGAVDAFPFALRQAAARTAVSTTANLKDGAPFVTPYKYTSDNMNWNNNVMSTFENRRLVDDMKQQGATGVTIAFATGQCGSEQWDSISSNDLRNANLGPLRDAGISFRLSTGGAGGSFTCNNQAGFDQFVSGWVGNGLTGVDFDIENGQSDDEVNNLVWRVHEALGKYPSLTFAFTVATTGGSMQGQQWATPYPQGQAPDPFQGGAGQTVLWKIMGAFGFQQGNPNSWPDSRLRINLMAMDYDTANTGSCVIGGDGRCQMAQTAIQAAYNLNEHWGVPMNAIELTPMIGDQDDKAGVFTPDDAATLVQWARQNGLAGLHYWAYDRDTPCQTAPSSGSSDVCNTAPNVQEHSFLQRFLQANAEVDAKMQQHSKVALQ